MNKLSRILLGLTLVTLLIFTGTAADVTRWWWGLYPCAEQVTGQLVQYDGQDDDGFYEEGIARTYTAFNAGQYAGTTNITVNAKTIAMENACVVDNNSGLMWMKYTPDSNIGPGNDGKLYWYKAADTENIFEFCTQANAASLAGHTDWRVPNVFELFSLIVEDAGIGGPYINTTYFQCVNSYYWTSTTYPGGTAHALFVYFNYGIVNYHDKGTNLYYVRLVRG